MSKGKRKIDKDWRDWKELFIIIRNFNLWALSVIFACLLGVYVNILSEDISKNELHRTLVLAGFPFLLLIISIIIYPIFIRPFIDLTDRIEKSKIKKKKMTKK